MGKGERVDMLHLANLGKGYTGIHCGILKVGNSTK